MWGIVMCLAGAMLGIIALGLFMGVKGKEKSPDAVKQRVTGVIFTIVAIGLFVPPFVGNVSTGHVGVSVVFNKVNLDKIYPEGLFFKWPWEDIYDRSVQALNNNFTDRTQIPSKSKEGLQMPIEASVSWQIVAPDAPWLHQRIGDEAAIAATVVVPAFREAVRNAAGDMRAEDAYGEKREELRDHIHDAFVASLARFFSQYGLTEKPETNRGIIVQQVFLRDVDVPASIRTAIDAKQAAEQEISKLQFEVEQAKLRAERKRQEAAGERDFQKIVAETISPQFLVWKQLEVYQELVNAKNPPTIILPAPGAEGKINYFLQPGQK